MISRLFKSAIILGVAGVVAIVAGYAATRHQSSAPAGPIDKLTIAAPTGPHAALVYIAVARGYFAQEGLEVTLIPVIHGKAALELVSQGKADLGAATDVPFVLAVTKGENLGIVANMFNSTQDIAVVARRDRGIASARDLAGKRIGVTLGTASDYFVSALLIRHKLPPGSVTLVDLPPNQLAQELKNGTIDATSSWQPYAGNAQLALGATAVTFYEPLAYTETFNFIGRRDYLNGHSRAMGKLVRAILKAEQFNRDYPREALDLVAAHLKVEVSSLQPAWTAFNFTVDLLQTQLITFEEEVRWAMARGYIANGPIPNFLPNFYLDALATTRPERVTVVR